MSFHGIARPWFDDRTPEVYLKLLLASAGITNASIRAALAWVGDDQRDLDYHLSRWFGKPRSVAA